MLKLQPKRGRIVGIVWLGALWALLAPPASAWELEAGRATTVSTFALGGFTSVQFKTPFPSVPVVVVLATDEGSDASDLRIRNVTTTGFEVAPVETPGEDGPHISMTFDYIAAEIGIHTLPSGETVVVATHTTDSVQASSVVGVPQSLDTVPFGASLAATASVIATIQSMNSESAAVPGAASTPWLTPIPLNATASSVQLALERSEVAAGTVVPETIGFIAFPASMTGTFTALDGLPVDWEASNSADVIVGFDDACVEVPFSAAPFPDAHVVATKSSRDGGDGGWLRRCALTSTEIGLQVDEDVANDTERAHTTETVSILAFSRDFHAVFGGLLDAEKTVTLLSDPLNGDDDPFSIPGSIFRYETTIRNIGSGPVDDGSLVFIDTLPPEVALIVADNNAPGSNPFDVVEGSPESGLSVAFNGLGNLTDDIDFSNDNGVTFTYVPVPAADGSDPAVTQFRIRPSGTFAPTGPAGTPEFILRYDVVLR